MQKKLNDCTDAELTEIGYSQYEKLLDLQREIPQTEQILNAIRELKQQRAVVAQEAKSNGEKIIKAAKITKKRPVKPKSVKPKLVGTDE